MTTNRGTLLAVLYTLLAWNAYGQTYMIQTIAGGGLPNNILGASLNVGGIEGVAVDVNGNFFMTSTEYQGVLRQDAKTGILTVVAGNGTPGFSGDNGAATNAQLNGPTGIALDAAGNIFVADRANNRVRRISNGVINTVAGNGTIGFSGDNDAALKAQLSLPSGVAVDFAGNLFIADYGNRRVREVSNGVISTIAGGGAGFVFSGPATGVGLSGPLAIAVDSLGNIFFTDNSQIFHGIVFKVSQGRISVVAGEFMPVSEIPGTCYDGAATLTFFSSPSGVAVDLAGNVYIADTGDNCVRKISNGQVTRIAGFGVFYGPLGDGGPAMQASISFPEGVAVDNAGNLYITDNGTGRLRKVTNGVITTVAGGGTAGQNGPATDSQLYGPTGLAVSPSGELYVSDSGNQRVAKISNRAVMTLAGNGTPGYGGDGGRAVSASLFDPIALALDAAGNLFIAESDVGIREVSGGVISTVVEAFAGPLTPQSGVAIDSAGNFYFVAPSINCLFKVSNGVAATVPGTCGELSLPAAVALDSAGNVYVADTGHSRVVRLSDGILTSIAGNGTPGFSGDDGPATSARLYSPVMIALDSAGSVYIADSKNNRIRKVTQGVITTIAGNGKAGFSGDHGSAVDAALDNPTGVAVDVAGNVYIADTANNRVRELTACSAPGASCRTPHHPAFPRR